MKHLLITTIAALVLVGCGRQELLQWKFEKEFYAVGSIVSASFLIPAIVRTSAYSYKPHDARAMITLPPTSDRNPQPQPETIAQVFGFMRSVFVLSRAEFGVQFADFFVLGGKCLRGLGHKRLVFGDFQVVAGIQCF